MHRAAPATRRSAAQAPPREPPTSSESSARSLQATCKLLVAEAGTAKPRLDSICRSSILRSMPHSVSLIATIAAGFGLALVLGFVAARLRLPALVGYLLAGVVIGPATPGFVADIEMAGQL